MAKEALHIYTRVSTQTQQDEGTSLESQKELGIDKANELGFDHKVWNEGGASSHYEDFENRPVLLKLLSEIDEGNVNHLWVYNNDRLSRNQITAQTIRIQLQKNAVTLYTNNGQFDLNNPQDNFLKTILDGVAQLDNAQRAERTRLGKLNRVKQGFWMGGPPPYGFQIVKKKLVINPDESKWVRKIYEWYNDKKSIQHIKAELDKAGVKTKRKKSVWSLGSIQKILQNTHHVGRYTYVDSKTEEVVHCECPPIVSKSLWESVQNRRKNVLARRGQNNRTKRFYLLRNLLYCGHCESPMSGRIKESKNEYLYYCPRKERNWKKNAPKKADKWKRGKGCSMVRSLNIKETDKLVTNEVFKVVYDQNKIQSLIQQRIEREQSTKEDRGEDKNTQLKKLKNKQKRLKKEVKHIIQNIAEVETAKILKKKDERSAALILENLNTVLDETEAKIEQCKINIQELQSDGMSFKSMRELKYNPQRMEVTYDPEQIKEKLQFFINRIYVTYDKDKAEHELLICLKYPLVNKQKNFTVSLKKNKKKKSQQTAG